LRAVTPVELVTFAAAWALLSGGMQLLAALRLRQTIADELLLALGAMTSLAFGAISLFDPAAAAANFVGRLGAFGFVSGVLLGALGIRSRFWQLERQPAPPDTVLVYVPPTVYVTPGSYIPRGAEQQTAVAWRSVSP
jgi:hypothetical protein